MTGFNKARYRFSEEEEPEEHRTVRLYVENLIQNNGIEKLRKQKMTVKLEDGSLRTYEPDIPCQIETQMHIIEIDGESHEDDMRELKDAIRDEAFRKLGISTTRIRTDEVLSKHRLSDAEIMDRIRKTSSSILKS